MAKATRERLKQLHAADPAITKAEAARQLCISRERVGIIAEALGIEFQRKQARRGACSGCGRVRKFVRERLCAGCAGG
jgi:cell division protein FtsL